MLCFLYFNNIKSFTVIFSSYFPLFHFNDCFIPFLFLSFYLSTAFVFFVFVLFIFLSFFLLFFLLFELSSIKCRIFLSFCIFVMFVSISDHFFRSFLPLFFHSFLLFLPSLDQFIENFDLSQHGNKKFIYHNAVIEHNPNLIF